MLTFANLGKAGEHPIKESYPPRIVKHIASLLFIRVCCWVTVKKENPHPPLLKTQHNPIQNASRIQVVKNFLSDKIINTFIIEYTIEKVYGFNTKTEENNTLGITNNDTTEGMRNSN